MFKYITISSITALLLLSGCGKGSDDSEPTQDQNVVVVDDKKSNDGTTTDDTKQTTPTKTIADTLHLVDASGVPLPEGASVTIEKEESGASNSVALHKSSELPLVVDANGLVNVSGLSAGIYKVVVTIGGVKSETFLEISEENFQKYANVALPVVVDENGQATVVDAVIASISGTIYDITGSYIPGVQVSISGGAKTNGSFVTAFTDENGVYTLNINTSKENAEALLNATIYVKADGYTACSQTLKVTNKSNQSGVNFLLNQAVQTSDTLYSETFEGNTDGWVVEKLTGSNNNNTWHIHSSGLNLVNQSFTNNLVQLAPNDISNGLIPDPANGSKCFWYGDGTSENNALGSFIDATNQDSSSALSGGSSSSYNNGATLTSPSIDLSQATGSINLSFKTWWEIESVNPNANGYDIMTISASSDNGNTWVDIAKLNPLSDPNTGSINRSPIPFSNTGYNNAPLWQEQEGISLVDANGVSLAGKTIKLRYTFTTVDAAYNGFRGWMIDDVKINTGEGSFPLLISHAENTPTSTPNDVADLSSYGFIFIYKNINGAAVEDESNAYSGYAEYALESTSNTTSCLDFGFSTANSEAYDNGTGSVVTYNNGDYSKICTEIDYSNYSAKAGSETFIAHYNY